MVRNNLKEVAQLFFRLGLIAFGGPAAHIAMMEEEIVEKRKWMTQQHFLDLIGATNLIPGPNSTEMTMHCGHERAGWKGLFVAGACFIFPAVSLTLLIAWFYGSYGQLPEVQPFIYGIKPAVLSIILAAVYKLGKKALKNTQLIVLALLTMIVALLGVHEIIALFSAGFIGLVLHYMNSKSGTINSFAPTLLTIPSLSSLKIGWTFFKVGALLYGSGYVLFAYLDAELVNTGYLTREQLVDAIAIGQFTPGPVLSTATFIGYQLGGFGGAIAATLGIFLPSFLFVLLLNPLIPKMRKSKPLSAFLNATNAAAVAIILVVGIEIGQETLTDWRSIAIALLSALIIFCFKKLNSAYIVIGGALIGFCLQWIN